METIDETRSIDFRRLVLGALLTVTGVLTSWKSRGIWVKISFVDYRVSSEWYGRTVLVIGIVFVLTGILSFLDGSIPRFRFWVYAFTSFFGLVGLLIISIVGFRVRQIASDIGFRARAPERWFDGTILEGLGKLIARGSESISSVAQPRLASDWKVTLVALLLGTVASLLLTPWDEVRGKTEIEEVEE